LLGFDKENGNGKRERKTQRVKAIACVPEKREREKRAVKGALCFCFGIIINQTDYLFQ